MPLDVLIVDDSDVVRKILHSVLVRSQLPLGKVHEAKDGREALQKLLAERVA
jgi:YesN/AraC family two-component response regulator